MNSQWLVDVAVSCARLGSLGGERAGDMRRAYLMRGRDILVSLKTEGRLLPRHDWIEWFNGQLAQLAAITGEQDGASPLGELRTCSGIQAMGIGGSNYRACCRSHATV